MSAWKYKGKGQEKEMLSISCLVFSNKFILKLPNIYFFTLDWV